MTPNDPSLPESEDSPLHATIEFAAGFVGGLALYCLAHPQASRFLKQKLIELYENPPTGQAFLNHAQGYLTAWPALIDSDRPTPKKSEAFTFMPPATLSFFDYLKSMLPVKTTQAVVKPAPKKEPPKKFFSTKRK